MLEVVFNDSVAGAMLMAVGHQHSVGGATAVIFANEDGEQDAAFSQAEIEKFQREAVERERQGWENAVPLRANERTSSIFHWLCPLGIFHKPESGQSERKQSPC